MRLLICGDRDWTNYSLIMATILHLNPEVIIEGHARGADKMAGVAAQEFGIELAVFPAQWDKYGRAAGPIRNQQMIKEGKPDLIIAFHNHIEQSAGTANMLFKAEHQRIPYILVTEADA